MFLRCFFHYVKAIKKSAKRFGLSKDARFARTILEVCCIALLPNNFVSTGFEYIKSQINTLSSRWDRFVSYWGRQWASANISVYGLKNRTDNYSETLNKSTNLLSGRPHQTIWHVIRTIIAVEMEKTDELVEHDLGKMFKKNQNKNMIKLDQQILDAWLKFEETEDVGEFLRNASYRADFLCGEHAH